jgi:hypothetical protein
MEKGARVARGKDGKWAAGRVFDNEPNNDTFFPRVGGCLQNSGWECNFLFRDV